jgi:hypothetical protein
MALATDDTYNGRTARMFGCAARRQQVRVRYEEQSVTSERSGCRTRWTGLITASDEAFAPTNFVIHGKYAACGNISGSRQDGPSA